jgi:hypothetical protein
MNGIDWHTIGNPTFERIVDTLLSIEFGDRGRPIEGRGGEGGTPGDFSVDGGKIVFEYKYFPDGFPVKSSRRSQIKRSFKAACKGNPEEWILIVPTKLTFWEQKFMSQLAGDAGVKVGYRDRTWLDTELGLRPNLANYFRHYSNNDYLQEKAEQFKHNPVIKDSADLVERVRMLMAAAADADPDWTWDISTQDGMIVQTLRARHANAALLSPVELSFNTLIPAGSEKAKELQQADAFGYVKPISIPGNLVKDFRVTGPPIVAQAGEVAELQLVPIEPGEWVDADLVLTDDAGEVLGIYLARIRGAGKGREGFTFEVAVGSLLSMTFRAPHQMGQAGEADFSFAEATGAGIRDLFDATDFVCQLGAATRLQVKTGDAQVVLMDVAGQLNRSWVNDYRQVRAIADDLLVIEAETKARFRYPARIDAEERVMIRNIRLMLEGHVVAHPTWTTLTAQLTGIREEGLDRLLTVDPYWIVRSNEWATLPLLGQEIKLSEFCIGGIVTLEPGHLQEVQAALAAGTANGMTLRMSCRSGDRLRMYLGGRIDQHRTLEITPWNIEGINQMGLTVDGKPLDGKPELPG